MDQSRSCLNEFCCTNHDGRRGRIQTRMPRKLGDTDRHRWRIRMTSSNSRLNHRLVLLSSSSPSSFSESLFFFSVFLLSLTSILHPLGASGRLLPEGSRLGPGRRTPKDVGYGFVEIGRFSSEQDWNITAVHYRHNASGADFVSMSNGDPVKFFGVALKTLESDDYGAPHVLEHAVLSGSTKYPVYNMFQEIEKVSFATINAFTESDHTAYYCQSTNTKDFYNALNMWWEGVFHPLVLTEELIFRKEGWSYNLESANDNLTVEGVVLSEMKWHYSDGQYHKLLSFNKAAFPNTPYAYDVGGDPFQMTNLTYESLKNFYHKFYHPSNSFIAMYGDDDPTQRLRVLGDLLSNFTMNEDVRNRSTIKPLAPNGVERNASATYFGNEAYESSLVITWVLDVEMALDMEKRFQLERVPDILSVLLPSFLRSFSEASLSLDKYESPVLQLEFSDSSLTTTPPVLDTVLEALRNISRDPSLGRNAVAIVDANFRKKEIENKEIEDSIGSTISKDMVAFWKRGGDPLKCLNRTKSMQSGYERILSNESFFNALIRDLLISNQNRILVHLTSSNMSLLETQEAFDKALLERKRALTPKEINELVNKTKELDNFAKPRGAMANSILPSLTVEDLTLNIPTRNDKVHYIQGVKVVENYLDTNGVFYLDVAFNLGNFPQDLFPYAVALSAIWTHLSPKLPVGGDADGFKTNVSVWSVSASFDFFDGGLKQARGEANGSAYLIVKGKALSRDATPLVNLIRILLTSMELDDATSFSILSSIGSGFWTRQVPGYVILASQLRLAAKDSLGGWFKDSTSGYRASQSLTQFGEAAVNASFWNETLARIKLAHRFMVHYGAASISLIGEASAVQSVDLAVRALVAALPPPPATFRDFRFNNKWTPNETFANESASIQVLTYSNAKARNVYKGGWSPSGSGNVVAAVQSTWIYSTVRSRKHAYGGHALFDESTGLVSHQSWADPRTVKTLKVFDASANYLKTMTELDEDLTRIKATKLGKLNDINSPYKEGFARFRNLLTNVSAADIERRNNELLLTSLQDFQEFGAALMTSDGYSVVGASPQALAAAQVQDPSLNFVALNN